MESSRRDLPPLGSLVAFEAAARLLSFRAAGEELFLSQAAISKQIRLLEENLQQRLFERAHRRVTLTPEGRAFHHVVSRSLSQIGSVAMEMRRQTDDPPIRLSVGHSLAFLWLTRYLGAFHARHPHIMLDVSVLEEQVDPHSRLFDVNVIAGHGRWPGFEVVELWRENIFPVCSPSYLQRIGGLSGPEALLRADLLELDDAQPACSSWRTWLTAQNVRAPRRTPIVRMNSYPMLLDVVRTGIGVALGWDVLVESYLRDGTLVRPLPQVLQTETAYFVAWPSKAPLTASAQTFVNWLIECRDARRNPGGVL